jgi:hypothetical protein
MTAGPFRTQRARSTARSLPRPSPRPPRFSTGCNANHIISTSPAPIPTTNGHACFLAATCQSHRQCNAKCAAINARNTYDNQVCTSPQSCRPQPRAVSPAPSREPGGKRKAKNNPVPAIPQNTNHISAFSIRGTTDRESPRFV